MEINPETPDHLKHWILQTLNYFKVNVENVSCIKKKR